MNESYDFRGWATRNDIRCSDGVTIRHNAFKDQDGKVVPLVWNHQHNDPFNILGNVKLENRDEGVYAYGTFNGTEQGKVAKELIAHGDIDALSIWANKLTKTNGNDITHGTIREVSLVLAGANPGAYVVDVLSHGYGEDGDSGYILFSGEQLELMHADEESDTKENEQTTTSEQNSDEQKEKTIQDVLDSMSEEKRNLIYYLTGKIVEDGPESIKQSDLLEKDANYISQAEEASSKSIKEIFDSMTSDEKNVAYFLIGSAIEEYNKSNKNESEEDDEDEDTEGGNAEMKHNIFDQTEETRDDDVISHDALNAILKDSRNLGSLKNSFIAHAQEYGIENLEYLFPDARNLENRPEFIKRDTGWVAKFMNATRKTPFSRFKTMFADITEDEARAKGYLKGKIKKEEVFSLLKRSTDPTTVYKKQKMDRDDVLDITDFDVIDWLVGEMRIMLDEEIARAALIGDGRLASDDDHIDPSRIRPIVSDSDLFTIKKTVDVASAATDDDISKEFIRTAIKARKDYKGSGNPTLFTTEEYLTNMLLLTDLNGRDMYESVAKLANKLRVKDIVTVEVMEGFKNESNQDLLGIIVNPVDYTFGADKGGKINMFEDFDIDYNQQKYLLETRCSGALVKPYSAIALFLNRKA